MSPKSSRTRVSDLYTKLGGNPQYTAVFALSPDHGLGYSILLAGPTSSTDRIPLRDIVGTVFVTAAEHAAVENAERNFAGTFVDTSAQGSNLSLTIDTERPGLGMPALYLNGTESRSLLMGPGISIPPANLSVRLYPTGIEWNGADLAERSNVAVGGADANATYMSYRAWPRTVPEELRAEVEGCEGIFDHCTNAFTTDFYNLGGIGVDEFVLEVVAAKVISVTSILGGSKMLRMD